MNPLQLFYNNEVEREAVKAFLFQMLRELAADKAMEGEDTDGIQEAGACVENAFAKLEELYSTKRDGGVPNSR